MSKTKKKILEIVIRYEDHTELHITPEDVEKAQVWSRVRDIIRRLKDIPEDFDE